MEACLDDLRRDVAEFLVRMLGLCAQQLERVIGVVTGAGDDDAESLVGHRSRGERLLQVAGQLFALLQTSG